MSSARVGWLVQELEEENGSLQEELKSITDERDVLQREVDRQRRLLKNCVEEVFELKDELSHLLETHCPPAESQRQQRLCERLAKHITEIEREVAEKGVRVEAWRAEREKRDAAVQQLETSLVRQTQESKRLSHELEQALFKSEKQAHEYLHKIAELEESVDSITKQKADSDAGHASEVDQLRKSIDDAEKSVKSVSASQHQLTLARSQLSDLRRRLTERDGALADTGRQLTERNSQLAEARRTVEGKTAQVIGLKSALQDSKNRTNQQQRELAKKTKEDENQVKTITKKEAVIQRQKWKLEEVARDLNKLKAVFSDQDIPGLCDCNEVALGAGAHELRVLRAGRPLPACPAKQLRAHIDQLKKHLSTSQARTLQLEKSLEEISQKLPQMSAEADRAYIELQTRLQESQTAHQTAEAARQEQLKRGQQLMLKLAAAARKLRDGEQLTHRLRQENRSLVTSRLDWERTSAKLQAALQETVQLTAKLQAARVELTAEKKITAQLRQRLDTADQQMKSQLDAVVKELHQLKQTTGPSIDWPRKYELLLDKCRQWQEECLARQKECQVMEQRLGEVGSQQPDRMMEGAAPSAEEEQLSRMEAQLQTLLRVVGRAPASSAIPAPASRARSVPEIPVTWEDTSSGTLRSEQRVRERSRSPSRSSAQRSPLRPRQQSPHSAETRTTASARGRPPSAMPQSSCHKPATTHPSTTPTAAAAPDTQRTAASVAVPDLGPLLSRAAEAVHQLTQQRSQLSAQRRLLDQYRRRDAQEVALLPDPPEGDQETPCRDTGTQQAGDAHRQGDAALSGDVEGQMERLTQCRALQQLLSKMASPGGSLQSTEVEVPDVTELRAQWRRLETMVRDEAESARTRSDVILRMSGMSESSTQ